MAKQVKKRESSAQNADDSRASARGGNRRAGRDYRDGSEDGNSAPRRDAPPEGQPPEQIAMDRLMPMSGRRRFSEQYVPYLWAALALFLIVCFVLDVVGRAESPQEHLMGVVGYWICRVLFGLFGWAAFLLPAVNIMMAISWRRYCRERMVAFQIAMSALFMLLLSAFIHVCVCTSNEAYLTADPGTLFRTGAAFESGGVIGGWLGWLLYMGLRLPGSIVLMVITMPLVIMFLIGITPSDAFSRIKGLIRRAVQANRERSAARRRQKEEEHADRLRAEQRDRMAERRRTMRETEKHSPEPNRQPKEAVPAVVPAEDTAAPGADGEQFADSVATEPDGTGAAEAEADIVPAASDPDTRAAAEKRAVWVDPVTGEVLREGGMHGGTAEPGGQPAGDDSDAGAETPAVTRPVADRMEIDMDGVPEPERTDELPSPDDPLSGLPQIPGDERASAGGRVIRTDGQNTVHITVLPPESAALTGTPDNPVEGLPDEEVTSAGNTAPDAPEYVFPPLDILTKGSSRFEADDSQIQKNTQILQNTLESFKIRVKSVSCSCGPTVTRYEVKPEAGVRVRSISNLVDDISMNLAKAGVRIEAPIPGKSAVGIEVPNDNPSIVYLRNLLETPEFRNAKSRITACLGCEVSGRPVIFDINKMPHLLVSGTTGSGKSVCINCIILSILYKATPEEVKLILVDPKKVEFSMYRDIPHLYCPIVTDPKKAAGALYSAVAEMERRFELIEEVGVRNLAGYNEVTAGDNEHPPLPQMIIIIDELADLMMTAPADVESAICRLAQKGRAAGIHLILGTQRPSVDVITGLIKANIPSRIAFTVKSQVDSRTIIDVAGAEKLIGRGDMLYAPVGATKPLRVQGAFVSDGEVESVIEYVKEHNEKPVYDESFMQTIDAEAARCGSGKKRGGEDLSLDDIGGAGDGEDPKFWEAVEVAVDANKVSTSLLQRRLELGYGRAAKIIDRMQEMGFVSPADGNKPRKVLLAPQDLAEIKMNKRK